MSRISRHLVVLLTLLVGVLSGSAAPAAQPATSTPTTFSGRATVLSGTIVTGVPVPCVQGPASGCQGVVDTGPITAGSTEANLEASLLCYAVPDSSGCLLAPPDLTGNTLNAEVLHAAVVARGDTSRAEAFVANFNLNVAGAQIGARVLDSQAQAKCTGNGAVVKAGTETSVTINGTKYTVAAGETQTIPLTAAGVNVGFVVINEGASGPKSGTSIDASALHVVVPATGTNLTVAAVHADVVCGSALNCPGQHAFVTGGGYINDTTGDSAHFAVAGRDGQAWGHVLYKPTNLHVKNPFAIVYRNTSDLDNGLASHPEFKFTTSMLTGQPGTFQGAAILYWTDTGQANGTHVGEALAVDMGEPGNQPKGSDYFEIAGLSNGALASIAGGFLQGGNIQMHGKCPS